MPEKQPQNRSEKNRQLVVVTQEVAARLAQEAADLRQEVRRRVATMWNIDRDQRQARSR